MFLLFVDLGVANPHALYEIVVGLIRLVQYGVGILHLNEIGRYFTNIVIAVIMTIWPEHVTCV